ncbi:hypothetical protein KKF81_06285 [Candidatus Micrarchaeota archaeon]|nr:hypothetical protein [Candidatus Micrarchaeota archaeon]MBU1166538.1 hypothetical protein [Candidatus Micrarchaeota archaeon]MBU1887550.1 hypothetical protein [Candidatus Micrarchaeota archaeon]
MPSIFAKPSNLLSKEGERVAAEKKALRPLLWVVPTSVMVAGIYTSHCDMISSIEQSRASDLRKLKANEAGSEPDDIQLATVQVNLRYDSLVSEAEFKAGTGTAMIVAMCLVLIYYADKLLFAKRSSDYINKIIRK